MHGDLRGADVCISVALNWALFRQLIDLAGCVQVVCFEP